MRISIVMTYPFYHSGGNRAEWLNTPRRELWMAGMLAKAGHEVEIWGVDHQSDTTQWTAPGLGAFTVRIFRNTVRHKQGKHDYSDRLVSHARSFSPQLSVLKGTDGGAGRHLVQRYLAPEDKRYALIIGGKYFSDLTPGAHAVLYETEEQRQRLQKPGWRLWRPAIAPHRMIRLQKSLDTDHFRPLEQHRKEWDVIAVARLIPTKNLAALAPLSRHLRVAVVGRGPLEPRLRRLMPEVAWLGHVPNTKLPPVLNRARLLMHAGVDEFFPRVLAEAAACGLPCAAFSKGIQPDVLPASCCLYLDDYPASYVDAINSLLADGNRLADMGQAARAHALEHFHRRSTSDALEQLVLLCTPKT